MDNPTTLLVAIMYVTIVATGLVNVLMTLSEIVGGKRTTDPIHAGWLVLLLVAYLSFFWETTAILDIEGWDFLSFLSFITGPILLLFATNLITSPADSEEGVTLDVLLFPFLAWEPRPARQAHVGDFPDHGSALFVLQTSLVSKVLAVLG